MEITNDQLAELIEEPTAEHIATESWRHGHTDIYVVPFEDKFYRVSIPVHPEDGWQTGGSVEGVEVVKREVKNHEWVRP